MIIKKFTTQLLLWGLMLVAAFANAQTFNGSTVNTAGNSAIPSTGTGGCGVEPQTAATGGTRFNVAVAGVAAGNTLARINLNFTHTWTADVNMFLVSPSGAVLELSTGNGGSGDNFTNTVICDGAANSITAGAAPFTGSFRPEGTLTTFTCGITVTPTATTVAGMGSTAGTWQLLILDNAGGDNGTMLGWSLTFAPSCSFVAATLPAINVPGNTPGICGAQNVPVTAPALTCTSGTGTMDVALDGVTIATGVASGGSVLVTANSGPHTLTYTLPNCSFRTQAITITDGVAPTLICPASTTINLGPGECTAPFTYAVSCTDNCPLTLNGTVNHPIDFNNGQAGVMFDIQNISGSPFTIANFTPSLVAGTWPMEVWRTTTATTWNGNQTNAAAWTRIGTATVTSTGSNPGTVVPGFGLVLAPGQSMGIYITSTTGFPMNYTGLGTGTFREFNDGKLRVSANPGAGSAYPFAGAFVSRAYNGGVTYTAAAPGATQTAGLPSGSSFPRGTTVNSFSCTDLAGNTATCAFSVTVRDFPNYVTSLVCNDNVQLSLDEDCVVAINADQILEGGPYHCYDDYIVELDKTPPYDNGPWVPGIVGVNDINKTYGVRVTDTRTPFNKCWGSIKIEDKLPPVLNCQPITVPCNATLDPKLGVAAGTVSYSATGLPLAVPNQNFRDFTINVPARGVINDVDVLLNLTGNLYNGNVSIELFSPGGTRVLVWGTTFGCGALPIFARFDDEGSTALTCASISSGLNHQILFNYGLMSDFDGQLSAGTWRLRVTDLDAPVDNIVLNTFTLFFDLGPLEPGFPNGLSWPGDFVSQVNANTYIVRAGRGTPVIDNCTNVTLTYIDSKASLDCPNPLTGVVTRKWTATDASGNTTTCTQAISLDRPTLSSITLPPNYDDISAPAFSCLLGAYPSPEYIESQGLQGFPYLLGFPNGCSIGWDYEDLPIEVCDGTLKIRRKWTLVDWCTSEDREINQIIKVVDKAGPEFACAKIAPAFTTVAAAEAGGYLDVRADGPDAGTAPDTFYVFQRAIAPLEGMVAQRISNGALTGAIIGNIEFNIGTDFNKCCGSADLPDVIVSDACSRIKSVSAMVTVRDVYTGGILAMHTVAGTPSDFKDNNWWVPDTLAKMGKTPCLPVGTHEVVYMAEDDCGNTATCGFRLNVRDLIPPIVAADEFTQVTMGFNDDEDCYPGSPADSLAAAANCKFNGIVWIPAKNFDDGSYDNCGPVHFTIRRMPKRFNTVGTTQVPVYSDFIEGLNKEDGCIRCEQNDGLIFATVPTAGFPAGSSQVNTGFDPFGPICSPGFFAWKPDEYQRAWLEQDSIKFYCDEVGTRDTVILRVYQVDEFGCPKTDALGNRIFSEAMIAVDIVDKTRPSCTPPAHVTVSCENFDPSLWAYGQAKALDNCCLDLTKVYQGVKGISHTASYSQFDTTCNKGTIIRTFRSFDCSGNSASCTQRVVVTYEEDYYVRFPDDRIVTVCDGTGQYGAPTFFGEDCELLATSFKDDTFTVVPDACYKIERHWKVINWCTYDPNCALTYIPNPNPNVVVNNSANLPGPIVSDRCNAPTTDPWRSTRVKINPTDATETNYCTFWQKTASCSSGPAKFNGYQYTQIIKIVDGKPPVPQCVKPDTCDLTDNDPLFWNVDYWWDATHASHDLCEMPIDLKLTATDLCSGPNVNFRYLLFLDLDGNGTMETVVSSSQLPPTNTVYYGNALLPNYQGGTARAFDHRPVINPTLDWYRFAIQVTRSGANATAAVRFNTQRSPNTFVLPQLPHGKHKIKWIVEDGCGNEVVCEYPFEIKDCKKPTIVCKPLSVNIMQTGMVTLWASDFLEYAFDNCTPADQLKIAVSKGEPAPAAFPRDPVTRLPITQVNFTCADLGPNVIQLWAEDSRGNADYCQVVLLVQDNMGNCGARASVAGALKTETTQGVQEGNVELVSPSHPAFPPVYQMSSNTGAYMFSNAIPVQQNAKLTPVRNDNPLNGVTTLDLALMTKHILGIELLNSPYKIIAADANKSGSVTTFDVVELRKLILGIYDELPNNNSWRFVDKAYAFPNPSNPFQAQFPETKTIASVLQGTNMSEDFVGVKIGDVNGSVAANNLMSNDDRTAGTFFIDAQDATLKAGEEVTVNFKADSKAQAFQFTMNLNGLEVAEILPGATLTLDNFAVFQNAVTAAVENGAAEFAVKFRATKAGELSKMITANSRITKAVAYTDGGDQYDVAFRFNSANGSVVAGAGFELLQNTPNPVKNTTTIAFNLPEAAEATLTITNAEGRIVKTISGNYAKGINKVEVNAAELTTGILFYELKTATDRASKKMIVVDVR